MLVHLDFYSHHVLSSTYVDLGACFATEDVADLDGVAAAVGVVDQGDNCLYKAAGVNFVVDSDGVDIHDANFAGATKTLAAVAVVEGAVELHLHFFERGFLHDIASSLLVRKNPMF